MNFAAVRARHKCSERKEGIDGRSRIHGEGVGKIQEVQKDLFLSRDVDVGFLKCRVSISGEIIEEAKRNNPWGLCSSEILGRGYRSGTPARALDEGAIR